MKRITEKQALFLADVFCFTCICLMIGGLMYLTALAILSL